MIIEFIHLLKIAIMFPFTILKLRKRAQKHKRDRAKSIGILHIPAHTNAGGEKVLWSLVDFLLKLGDYQVVVYGDKVPDKDLMVDKINVPEGYLTYSHHYTFFSRYLEGLSHFLVLPCCFQHFIPDIFIDTMTAHFAMPAVKLIDRRIKVINYVHYPFTHKQVVTEYFSRVKSEPKLIKKVFAAVKGVYHAILYILYRQCGRACDLALANSSWTLNHTKRNWGKFTRCEKLYPPCNVDEFWCEDMSQKEEIMVSFAQFRPEKRHDLQLDIFKQFQKENPENKLQFKMVGTVKDEFSRELVQGLEKRIKKEDIKNVEIFKNRPFNDIRKLFAKASIGAHFMIDEHFGISIVEMLCAGMVVLAHNTAGPKNDILSDDGKGAKYGFLCGDEKDYLDKLNQAYRGLMKGGDEKKNLLERMETGRNRLKGLVSNEAFARRFYEFMKTV